MEAELEKFTHFLRGEKGLAENTVISYERDLKSYMKYVTRVEQLKEFNDIQRVHIIQFLGHLQEQGKSSRTIARHIASIRAMHQFLLREKSTDHDPSVLIEPPQIERSLPKVMSKEEVEILLNSPNTSDHYGLRDKAMLELLYATGIRVSELITLGARMFIYRWDLFVVLEKTIKNELYLLGKQQFMLLKNILIRVDLHLFHQKIRTTPCF